LIIFDSLQGKEIGEFLHFFAQIAKFKVFLLNDSQEPRPLIFPMLFDILKLFIKPRVLLLEGFEHFEFNVIGRPGGMIGRGFVGSRLGLR
jgi:hypothetical protein